MKSRSAKPFYQLADFPGLIIVPKDEGKAKSKLISKMNYSQNLLIKLSRLGNLLILFGSHSRLIPYHAKASCFEWPNLDLALVVIIHIWMR